MTQPSLSYLTVTVVVSPVYAIVTTKLTELAVPQCGANYNGNIIKLNNSWNYWILISLCRKVQLGWWLIFRVKFQVQVSVFKLDFQILKSL